MKTAILTALSLIAFAANSILCKLALGNKTIDASSFTILRLLSGAIVLLFLVKLSSTSKDVLTKGNWMASSMLFLYAASFSYAYISLDTGTGALILFGAVQITIILYAIIKRNILSYKEWIGIFISLFGFIYLVLPGVNTPPLVGFILMVIAGISWGIYTIKGFTSNTPLIDTSSNFIKTIPLILILLLITIKNASYSLEGILLACISGGITSGIGYAIWYMAIKGLSKTQTAVVQLLVPILAAFGGVLFMSEIISVRLVIASILILGGILTVTLFKTTN